MKKLLPVLFAAAVLIPLPCSAHAVVDLAIRFAAPDYVPAGATVPIDVIVDANAYDSAYGVTLDIIVDNGHVSSADAAWRCTSGPELVECAAEELKAGPHVVHLDVKVPSTSPLRIRAKVDSIGSFDPRADNDDVTTTSRVFVPAQCTQNAPQLIGDLQWAASAGATSYDVFYGIDGESPHLVASTTDSDSRIRAPGGNVQWFVRAHFDGCPSLDSPFATFESQNPPLQLVTATAARDPLTAPESVAVDGTHVFVTDPSAKKLYTFDAASGALAQYVLLGDVVTDPPLLDGGIAIGPGPYLYDADRGTHSVRFTDSTRYMFFAAGQARNAGTVDGRGNAARFDAPSAVAVTPDAQLFVTDSVSNVVRRIAYNSTKFDFDVTTYAGVVGAGGFADGVGAAVHFNEPAGIAVDRSGNVFVADRGNHVIRKIAPNGSVSTIAGAPAVPGHRDGDAQSALFDRPYGIAIDAWGNLYVTEEANHDIRKIAPNGRVTTVAGDPDHPGSSDGVGSDAHFLKPALLAIASDGTLWVPDAGNGRLVHAALSAGERRRAAHH